MGILPLCFVQCGSDGRSSRPVTHRHGRAWAWVSRLYRKNRLPPRVAGLGMLTGERRALPSPRPKDGESVMPVTCPRIRAVMLALPLALIAAQAGAHTGEGINSGFASGFWHPIYGWDHVVAMVAVGLWGRLSRVARDLDPAGGLSAGHGAGRGAGRDRRAAARRRDGHRAVRCGSGPADRLRGARADLGRRRHRRRLRHFPRARAWHRTCPKPSAPMATPWALSWARACCTWPGSRWGS